MCLAALHWARVETVYFGATIADAQAVGFNELTVSAEELLRRGGSSLRLVPGLLEDECREVMVEWRRQPHRQDY